MAPIPVTMTPSAAQPPITSIVPGTHAISDREIKALALGVQAALTQLGLARQSKDGELIEVQFKRLQRSRTGRYVMLEVDTEPEHLPARIGIPDLETPRVLTHLSSVLHRTVRRLNHVGLTYVVCMQPPEKLKPLPKEAALPAAPPEGMQYAWPFGVNRDGEQVWASLGRTGHMLIGGITGGGKSTTLHAGLLSLLRANGPDRLQMVMVDLKRVELSFYKDLPHVARIAKDEAAAAELVEWLHAEMLRREQLLEAAGKRNWAAYNQTAAKFLPLLVAVFDELTDLVVGWGGTKSAPFKTLIRLASAARAFGIVLIFSTQHPKAEIFDTSVRENCLTRVALKVRAPEQSRVILGIRGAEALPEQMPGRCVVVGINRDPLVLQGFNVSDDEMEAAIRGLRGAPISPLSTIEAQMVLYARDSLGGAFTINRLHTAFVERPGHLSNPALRKLASTWEARGWLAPCPDAAKGRPITPELIEYAQRRVEIDAAAATAVPRLAADDTEPDESPD